MSPLERRYRRLLRLLPAHDRATRGEELLGMLLDLDDGRRRPSVRQAGGVVALALRLRFVHIGSLLLASLLIAFSSGTIDQAIDIFSGSMTVGGRDPVLVLSTLVVSTLLRLAGTIAWVVGSRVIALSCYAGLVAGSVAAFGLGGVTQVDLAALVLLGFAAWRRWPAPGARPVLLATFPLAVALWWLTEVWGRHGMYYPQIDPRVTWSLAVVGAAAGWLLTRRRSGLTRVAVMVGGGLAPAVTPSLVYGRHGWLLSVVVAVALLGVAGGSLRRRSTAVPRADRRSPRGTTE